MRPTPSMAGWMILMLGVARLYLPLPAGAYLVAAEAAAGVGISLTAGFVSWALRAGSMAASFLAAMPTWRHFDPMPVLAQDDESSTDRPDEDDADEQEEKAIEEFFER